MILHPTFPLLIPYEYAQPYNIKAPNDDVYAIRTKIRLMINAWKTRRDPKMWEDPFTFKPRDSWGWDEEERML